MIGKLCALTLYDFFHKRQIYTISIGALQRMNIKFLFHRCRGQLKESQYVERDIGEFYMNFLSSECNVSLETLCFSFFLDYVISELCMLRKNGPVGRNKHVSFSEYVTVAGSSCATMQNLSCSPLRNIIIHQKHCEVSGRFQNRICS